MFYVYEWFIKETDEIIYVGKGCRNRYKVRKHNRFFAKNHVTHCTKDYNDQQPKDLLSKKSVDGY